MKVLVVPNNKKQIENLLNTDIDGIVLGVKDLSVYFNFVLDISEIEEIIQNTSKEVFLSVNKIMHNKDISKVREILLKLENMNIKGLFISDIGVFNIIKENNMNIDVVMNQTHLITNYKTCNYWRDFGVKYAKLSVELMLDEINEISDKTDILTIANIFGYIPMFNSQRKLLTNYFKYINEEKEFDKYCILDEDRNTKYIIDEKEQTVIFSNNIMNAIRETADMKCDYGIINGYGIESEVLLTVVDAFINKTKSYKELNEIIDNMDTGFLYKESIYKVRNHE